MAAGAGLYLVVWREVTDANTSKILATRMTPAGIVEDDPPLQIATATSSTTTVALHFPTVGFDGTRFFIAWVEQSMAPYSIFGAYLDPQGNTSMPFRVSPTTATASVNRPSVGAGNGHVLVAWGDGRRVPSQLRGALLDDTGVVTGKGDLPLSQSTDPVEAGAVTWGGPSANNFLVAWEQNTTGLPQVFGTFVDATGGISPAMPFQISTPAAGVADAYDPAIATDGTQYLVVWPDDRNDPSMATIDLWARLIPFTSAPTAADFQVAAAPANEFFIPVQATFAASNWVLAWEHGAGGPAELLGQRRARSGPLEANGAPLSTAPRSNPPLLTERGLPQSAIATDGATAFVAYTSNYGFSFIGSDALVAPESPSSPTLTPQAPIIASRGRNYELTRAGATDGSVFLVVWEDDRNIATTGLDIYGLRFGSDGTPLDAAPFPVCKAAGDQFLPSVGAAPGGSGFLVAWSDARDPNVMNPVDIYAARVPAQGVPPDGDGFAVRTGVVGFGAVQPTVAASPSGWLVAWEDWRSSPFPNQAPEVWAALVSPSKQVGTALQLTKQSDDWACEASATWDGKSFFVAYEQPCSHPYKGAKANTDIRGSWVNSDGTKGQSVVLASSTNAEFSPSVAADGAGGVVPSWLTATGEVIAGRLANGATTLQGAPGSVYANAAVPPQSSGLVVAGQAVMFTFVDATGVHGIRTDASLKPIDVDSTGAPSAFVVEAGKPFTVTRELKDATFQETARELAFLWQSTPRVATAALATGETLVAYNLLETLAGKLTPRVHVRKLGVLPRGAVCTSVSGCADTFCSGGFCCDTPCDGICQRCGANGCIEAPPSDNRCGSDGGTISCAALDTVCRAYRDVPTNRCQAFGVCAESGSPAVCTDFTDAPDGTACTSAAGGQLVGGTCRAGACQVPYAPLQVALRTPVAGCALSSGATTTAPLALLFIALLAVTWRRSGAR